MRRDFPKNRRKIFCVRSLRRKLSQISKIFADVNFAFANCVAKSSLDRVPLPRRSLRFCDLRLRFCGLRLRFCDFCTVVCGQKIICGFVCVEICVRKFFCVCDFCVRRFIFTVFPVAFSALNLQFAPHDHVISS